MSRKLMSGLAVAAALCMAAPAWADHDGRGRGHGNGYSNGHGYGNAHWKHGHRGPRHHVRERVVVREYMRPAPVYSQAAYPAYQAPAAGIHFVLPDIFIPFR